MHIHEYQAKSLLEKYGIKVPPFAVVSNEEEVKEAIERLNLKEAVIKVQIHAGGRGKAGGVKFAKNPEEILKFSKELFKKRIINNQTGPIGLVAEKLLISPPLKIKKEFYLSALIDRKSRAAYLIASKEGGTEIEIVAEQNPGAIFKEKIEMNGKLWQFQLYTLAKNLGFKQELMKKGMAFFAKLAKMFTEIDASLFEINPLVLTEEEELVPLDAKCTLDENAFFRHKEFEEFYDPTQETPNEVEARQHGLSYVGLEGNIGCMVNGAGLAMATMDILHYYGGHPANFLDAGGGASLEKITEGFKILLRDPKVKCIFVNIFGGIMDCSLIAEGIVRATKEEHAKTPLVVRLEGTNVEKGKQILRDSKLPIFAANTMADGAMEAVKRSKNGPR